MSRQRTLKHLLPCLLAGLASTLALAWLPALHLPDSAVSLSSPGATSANGPVVAEPSGYEPVTGYVTRHDARTRTTVEVAQPFLVEASAPGASTGPLSLPGLPRWTARTPRLHVPRPQQPSWDRLTPGWAMRRASEVLHTPPTGSMPARHLTLEARGWPLRAVFYESTARYDRSAGKSVSLRGGLVVPHPRTADAVATRGHGVTLPLIPIWPGLAANTALFSAAWAIPILGIPLARSALRRRRGRCPRCAYDLRGLRAGSLCPECGVGSRPAPPTAKTASQASPIEA